MDEYMAGQLGRTAAHICDYCFEGFEKEPGPSSGVPEGDIVDHNNTRHHDMGLEITGRAIDELVKVGLLKAVVYEGSRTVFRGDNWPQRVSIIKAMGWRS